MHNAREFRANRGDQPLAKHDKRDSPRNVLRNGLGGMQNSAAGHCATLSHMEIGVRDLRNRTGQVIDAVKAGERVTLTVHGEPIADIVPHGRRTRWLAGARLREQLQDRAADPGLQRDLDELAGQTLDEL
jgi:prevent-host-death family protein